MKRILALALVLVLLLCGCGGNKEQASAQTPPETQAAAPAETTAATEPATEPTTVPTEPPVYHNPLNGEIIDAPFTGRVYANTVSNLQENLPHVGVTQADILIETYVNRSNVVRCLALFTDIESVEAIGSTRSTRPIFNDIAQHYDLILSHAGGSDTALNDAADRGIDNFNIDAWAVQSTGASYRDKEHKRSYENTLYGIGTGIKNYAASQGYAMELERDYGLSFVEDGTPAEGQDASQVGITLVFGQARKDTLMKYDAELGKYVWNQYGKEMKDLLTEEVEAFTNVIVMYAPIETTDLYHRADFLAGGNGYYANGGKMIPITWTCDGDDQPFRFFTEAGEPLNIGVGNTYLAIAAENTVVNAIP